MKYYRVSVAFEQVYEVLVKAKDEIEAERYALKNWGEDDAINTNIEVFDMQQMEVIGRKKK